jgi:ATP-dependent helicase/nuclease subunit A
VRELRRRRFDRAPGATARDLLERTAFARAVARGPNGAQRLARLRELCLLLEQRAAEDGLDYDAVTAELRGWVDAPAQVDPPYPVGTEAIQVLTVHQAKGLEFPVVVLWDGKGQWDTRVQLEPWRMERDGPGWIVNLEGLSSEEPPGLGLRVTERRYLDAERRRVVYVAATRARDLLVVPRAGQVTPGKLVCADLLEGCEPALVHELPPYREAALPPWARLAPADAVAAADGAAVEHDVMARWAAAGAEAARPRFKPASVSGEAHALRANEVQNFDEGPGAVKPREGRFGPLFGTVVHAAIGLVLHDEGLSIEEAVRRAAGHAGLDEHLDDADADVGRAIETLRAEGLARRPGSDLQLEYPVAGLGDGGLLLTGYVDLVSATDDRLDVLDFKTDAPPAGTVGEVYPAYAWQAATYGQLLSAAGVAPGRPLRCGLLFTADGGIRWV